MTVLNWDSDVAISAGLVFTCTRTAFPRNSEDGSRSFYGASDEGMA